MLHQDWVESRWEWAGDAHRGSPPRELPWRWLPISEGVDADRPIEVLEHLFEHLPDELRVYPTERYAYYEFLTPTRHIAGNLRFTSIEDGVLHIGYYDRRDPLFLRHRSFGAEDGVDVRYDAERMVARVGAFGRVVDFHLSREELAVDSGLALLPGETAVTGVLDESGFGFTLVYYAPRSQFYYVLNPQARLPDRMQEVAVGGVRLLVGVESGFVFYRDEALDREILIAIHESEVRSNFYFDGPFDQVPPNLPLRPMLEAAYPYVMQRGGIDEHGNFNEVEGSRVAISPYRDIASLSQYLGEIEGLIRPELPAPQRWLRAVFEPKSVFHQQLGPGWVGSSPHRLITSGSWPANHLRDISAGWGEGHLRSTSLRTPPNQPTPAEPASPSGGGEG